MRWTVRILLPAALRRWVEDAEAVTVAAGTVGEAVQELEARHPRIMGSVVDEQGRLRPHVNLFLGGKRVGLDTLVEGDTDLHVLQAISGG